METVQQKGTSQKELITLKNKIQLKQLAAIKLESVKPIGSLQEVKGESDAEKSVRVWRGSSGNPLSVGIRSDDDASGYGWRFGLYGYGPAEASRAVGAVKDGELKLYELSKGGEVFKANYAKMLEIVNEIGAELPAYQIAIPAIAQVLASTELDKGQQNAIKDLWFYAQGKEEDLANLKDWIYTWDKSKEYVPTGRATKAIEAVKAELQALQHGIEDETQLVKSLDQNKAAIEAQIAQRTAVLAEKANEEKRLSEALSVLERKE